MMSISSDAAEKKKGKKKAKAFDMDAALLAATGEAANGAEEVQEEPVGKASRSCQIKGADICIIICALCCVSCAFGKYASATATQTRRLLQANL